MRTFYIINHLSDEEFPDNLVQVREEHDGYWLDSFQSNVEKLEDTFSNLLARHMAGDILRNNTEQPDRPDIIGTRDLIMLFSSIVKMERHPPTLLYHELWIKRVLLRRKWDADKLYVYIHRHYRWHWQDDPDYKARRTMVMLAQGASHGASLTSKLPTELLRRLMEFLTYN